MIITSVFNFLSKNMSLVVPKSLLSKSSWLGPWPRKRWLGTPSLKLPKLLISDRWHWLIILSATDSP